MNVIITPHYLNASFTLSSLWTDNPGIKSTRFCKPTPIYNPIHQPIIPPKTDANVVRKVIKKIFFGFEITHAASKGSIGIGKNIDSEKDKP